MARSQQRPCSTQSSWCSSWMQLHEEVGPISGWKNTTFLLVQACNFVLATGNTSLTKTISIPAFSELWTWRVPHLWREFAQLLRRCSCDRHPDLIYRPAAFLWSLARGGKLKGWDNTMLLCARVLKTYTRRKPDSLVSFQHFFKWSKTIEEIWRDIEPNFKVKPHSANVSTRTARQRGQVRLRLCVCVCVCVWIISHRSAWCLTETWQQGSTEEQGESWAYVKRDSSCPPLYPPNPTEALACQRPPLRCLGDLFSHAGDMALQQCACVGGCTWKCHYPLLSSHEAITRGN